MKEFLRILSRILPAYSAILVLYTVSLFASLFMLVLVSPNYSYKHYSLLVRVLVFLKNSYIYFNVTGFPYETIFKKWGMGGGVR